jgi:dihydrofolate reductase
MACSLDGFIAGPDDDLSFLQDAPPPSELDVHDDAVLTFEGFLGQVGAMLMGRNTHDVVKGFGVWPYGDMPVLVPTHRPMDPAADTVTAVSGDIGDLLARAQAAAGDRDVYLDGGAVIHQALNAGLVDEMCVTLVPTLLGGGVRLFDGLIQKSQWAFVGHARMGHMVQLTLRPVR